MSIKSGLYQHLTADPGVAALVGTRVYPNVIPEQVYDEASKRPCIVYRQEGVERTPLTCATDPVRKSRFAFDCYARRYADAETLGQALTAALLDFSGAMGDALVERIFLEDEYDLEDPDPGLFRNHLVFSIWHQ